MLEIHSDKTDIDPNLHCKKSNKIKEKRKCGNTSYRIRMEKGRLKECVHGRGNNKC